MDINGNPTNFPQVIFINEVGKAGMLTLYGLIFNNSICVYVYQKEPNMGSLSIGLPDGNTMTVFAGKNELYSESLSKILAKDSKKGVYASVFLESNSMVMISDIGIIAKKFMTEFEKLKTKD